MARFALMQSRDGFRQWVARRSATQRVLAAALPLAVLIPLSGVLAASGAAPLQRGLETVDISLAPDGAIRTISASHTQITLDEGGVTADTNAQAFAPLDYAQNLPVRVLASYSTAERSGTDLAQANGAKGRVRIDLQIHNLTVSPQEVTFDTNGRSVTRQELVGVPLTVVASTTLKGSPSQVVTAPLPAGASTTNGVVSRDASGDTVVQWAAVLAPPVLDAAAQFSLVVDTEDFELSDFDISVQPGIITDASAEGLLDTAFRPAETSEGRLTARTIDVLTQAQNVFSESGKSLTEVRERLQDSAERIGSRTIADLKASNERIQGSARGLSSTLNTLNGSLTSELHSTDSAVSSGLLATTRQVADLLGDTRQQAPTIVLEGSACEVKIVQTEENPPQGVFGMLLTMNAALDAYAEAGKECQDMNQVELLKAIGPQIPSQEVCQSASETMTCNLYSAQAEIEQAVEGLRNNTAEAVNRMKDLPAADAASEMSRLSNDIDQLRRVVTQASGFSPNASVEEKLSAIESANNNVRQGIDALESTLNSIRQEAQEGTATSNQIESRLQTVKTTLCEASGMTSTAGQPGGNPGPTPADPGAGGGAGQPNPPQPATPDIRQEVAEELLGLLMRNGCPPTQGAGQGDELLGADTSIQALNEANRTRYDRIIELTEEGNGVQGGNLASAIATWKDESAAITQAIAHIRSHATSDSHTLRARFADVASSVTALEKQRDRSKQLVDDLNDELSAIHAEVLTLMNNASVSVTEETRQALAEASKKAWRTSSGLGQANSALVTRIIDNLSDASHSIVIESSTALDVAKKTTEDRNLALSQEASTQLTASVDAVSRSVNAAVRDSDGAAALLSQDIGRVLADIGENKDKGTGLLGTVATSNAQLGVADLKMASSATNTADFNTVQRGNLDAQLLRSAQLRSSFARLETLPTFADLSSHSAQIVSVYNFRIAGK